uniref:SFRICE_029086 n=1 Tax=Spodoptera frugiperda TaxID=7108 RepID=A0A2H1WHZ8_SPOFR
MNLCSLISLKLENGWIYLANFGIEGVEVQGRFKRYFDTVVSAMITDELMMMMNINKHTRCWCRRGGGGMAARLVTWLSGGLLLHNMPRRKNSSCGH